MNNETRLLEHCDAVENLTYSRRLTESEREDVVKRLVELNSELAAAHDEKRAAAKEFNDRIGELKAETKVLFRRLETNTLEVTEDCYKFIEDGVASYFNPEGVEVYRRTATAEENQLTIQAALREQDTETAD